MVKQLSNHPFTEIHGINQSCVVNMFLTLNDIMYLTLPLPIFLILLILLSSTDAAHLQNSTGKGHYKKNTRSVPKNTLYNYYDTFPIQCIYNLFNVASECVLLSTNKEYNVPATSLYNKYRIGAKCSEKYTIVTHRQLRPQFI